MAEHQMVEVLRSPWLDDGARVRLWCVDCETQADIAIAPAGKIDEIVGLVRRGHATEVFDDRSA